MVKGLEIFRRHFEGYADQYLIIGGTACDIAMEELGEKFRATKDLDIVLCIEALRPDFVQVFWDFIRLGAYSQRQKSTGKKLFYRFSHPGDESYPFMLELFSRTPEVLSHTVTGRLTPIPMEEDVSSLSAILLDDDYYNFIVEGRTLTKGVSILAPPYLIPLKTKAWQDLSERQQRGETISMTDIKKHQNDVFRLFRILNPDQPLLLPEELKENMRIFLATMLHRKVELKPFGYRDSSLEAVLKEIHHFYGLDS